MNGLYDCVIERTYKITSKIEVVFSNYFLIIYLTASKLRRLSTTHTTKVLGEHNRAQFSTSLLRRRHITPRRAAKTPHAT